MIAISFEIIIKFILSYLLGSISGSMLLGKFKRVDIRQMGSGNAGGTNAFRTMGTKFAIGVILVDIFKGYIAVQIISNLQLLTSNINTSIYLFLPSICAIGSVLGHVYPIFYSFKGGKGAGTMVGVLIALFPIGFIFCISFWIISLILSGYVGLSTILAGISLPITTAIFYEGGLVSPFGLFSIVISIFIIFTHQSNIRRMIIGSENRFQKVMIFKKRNN